MSAVTGTVHNAFIVLFGYCLYCKSEQRGATCTVADGNERVTLGDDA